MNLKLLLTTTLLSTVVLNAACSDPSEPDPSPDAAVDPALLAVTVAATKVPILQGTTATVEVSVVREAGIDGAIAIAAEDLPPGVTADPVTLAPGATAATLTLHAGASAPHSLPTSVRVHATTSGAEAMTEMTVTVYGPPGSVDTSFGGGKLLLPAGISDDYANALAIQPDGKIILAGSAAEHAGDFAMIRLDRDGAVDASFGAGGRVLTDFGGSDEIHAIALQPDGKIVVAGSTSSTATANDFAVARYLEDGSLDPTFGVAGKVTAVLGTDADNAYAVLVQPDGKILVGGDSNLGSSSTGKDFALVRYTSAGQLDTSWNSTGIVLTAVRPNSAGDSIYALALQTIGGEARVVAAGGEGDFTVVRYTPSGALDATFAGDGTVANVFGSTFGAARSIAITASGRIAIAGHAQHDFAVLMLEQSGALDTSFGGDGMVVTSLTDSWDEAQGMTIDADGKLVVAGWQYEGVSSAGNFVVLRYLPGGALDTSFGTTGIVETPMAASAKRDQAMAVAIQSDERVPTTRIITAGWASNSDADFAVARYWR